MPARTKDSPGTPSWVDLATAKMAASLGATVLAEPTDIPPGRFAAILDPQGAAFSVLTWTDPTD